MSASISIIECKDQGLLIKYNTEALVVILTNSRSTTNEVYTILYSFTFNHINAFKRGDFVLDKTREPYTITFQIPFLKPIALELHSYDEYHDYMLSFEYGVLKAIVQGNPPDYTSDEIALRRLDQEDDNNDLKLSSNDKGSC